MLRLVLIGAGDLLHQSRADERNRDKFSAFKKQQTFVCCFFSSNISCRPNGVKQNYTYNSLARVMAGGNDGNSGNDQPPIFFSREVNLTHSLPRRC